MGPAAKRRLGATLRALRPCAAALDPRSAAFGSGAPLDLPPNHPSTWSAPDEWKFEPDLESAARFAPSGVLTTAEQERLRRELRYFREHGCIMIPDALVGEQLTRTQQAYERVLGAAREEWEAEDPAERGPFEPSLPGQEIFELEDDMLALIDNPRLLPLLSQCIGEDLQIRQVQTRYNPGLGDPSLAEEFVDPLHLKKAGDKIPGWHRVRHPDPQPSPPHANGKGMDCRQDRPNIHNNATGRSIWLKVFSYFYDVAEHGGPTALV